MLGLTTSEGLYVVAPDRKGLVRALKNEAWMWEDTKHEYMEAVAERVEGMTTIRIDTATCEDFLDGLETLGLIEVEELE
jgi:hypothetical protein